MLWTLQAGGSTACPEEANIAPELLRQPRPLAKDHVPMALSFPFKIFKCPYCTGFLLKGYKYDQVSI